MNCHTCGRGLAEHSAIPKDGVPKATRVQAWHCICCGSYHVQQPGRTVEVFVPAVTSRARQFLEAFILTVIGTEAATPEILELMKGLHAMCRNAPTESSFSIPVNDEDMTKLAGWMSAGVGEVSSDELVRKMMDAVTRIWPPPANPAALQTLAREKSWRRR